MLGKGILYWRKQFKVAGVGFVKLRNDATKSIFTLFLIDLNVEKVNQLVGMSS